MRLTPKANILKVSWLLPSFLSVFLLGSNVQAATKLQEISSIQPSTASTVDDKTLFAGVVPLNSPMTVLEPQIKALMARYSFLKTGMFFLDLDTGNYLDVEGDRVFPAASTIKLPILIAFFQDLDAGKVTLKVRSLPSITYNRTDSQQPQSFCWSCRTRSLLNSLL
jgi:beta-lactamase class A